MPRYTRDEILLQGLDLASSPSLTTHDAPGGIISSNAHCIYWLQNALDMFHIKYPFSSDVVSASITFPSNSDELYITPGVFLPSDFIIEVRRGLIATVNNQSYRLEKKSFQQFLDLQLNSQSTTNPDNPRFYSKVNNRYKFTPRVQNNTSGTLWYYKLPSKLDSDDYPSFPDEHSLIEFIRIKALEWTRSVDLGTAVAYLQKELVRFRVAGLLDEAEYDIAPLENNQALVAASVSNRNSWMLR